VALRRSSHMRSLVWRSVAEVCKVRELDYAFTEGVGVMVAIDELSPAMLFWELITSSTSTLIDPATGWWIGVTLDEAERRAVQAHDEERRRACRFFELTDRLTNVEEQAAKPDPRFGGYNHTVRQANDAFSAWEHATLCADQSTALWSMYRDDRVERLTKALAMTPQLRKLGSSERHLAKETGTEPSWWPSEALFFQLQTELEELKQGLKLSKWYYIQTLMVEHTGRPLFSLNEISSDGRLLRADADPNHRPPVALDLMERLRLLQLAG